MSGNFVAKCGSMLNLVPLLLFGAAHWWHDHWRVQFVTPYKNQAVQQSHNQDSSMVNSKMDSQAKEQ